MADEIQNIKIKIIGEADFSQAEKEIKELTNAEQQMLNVLKSIDDNAKLTNKHLQEESEKSQKAIKKTGDSFGDLKNQVKGVAQQIPGAFQVEQILSFSSSMKGAVSSTGMLSGAMNILKIAIASTGIGLLVIALGSLVAYLTMSESGSDRLAKIMNVLKVIFSQVMTVVIALGEKVFDFISGALKGFSTLVTYIEKTVFGAFEELSGILRALGFDEAADSVDNFSASLKKSEEDLKRQTAALIQLGEEIADMEDKLGAMTIDIALANSKLTTEIDKTLKSLRNRNNTYQENLELIEKVGDAEKQRLANSVKLIDLELQIKEKQFQRDMGLTEESRRLFNAFINGQISAELLLDKVKGQVKEDDVKAISEILLKKEDASRQSMVLEERLENLKAQNAQNEKARQDKIKADKAKADADEKKRLDELEKIAQRERDAWEKVIEFRIAQNIKANQEIVENDKLTSQERISAAQNKLLQEQDLLETRHQYEIDNFKGTNSEKLLLQEKFGADMKQLEKDYAKDITKIKEDEEKKKQAADKETAANQKKLDDEAKARKQQLANAGVQLVQEIGNGLFQLQKDNIQRDLDALDAKQAQELERVGNNAQAQAFIKAKYAKLEADEKRKAAQADKEQAIFNIVLQTAVNTVKALGTLPVPNIALAALVGGLGAVQLGLALSKPLPKFNKGTKSVPGYDTGDDSIIAMLRPGEGVMPVDRMKDYKPAFDAIFDRKVPAGFINSMVMDYDRLGRGIPVNQGSDIISLKNELKDINKKLSKLSILEVNMDQKGFHKFIKNENSRTQIENNYLRSK